MTEGERVRAFVAGLNALVSQTGLVPVGTAASFFSFRLVAPGPAMTESRPGVTVDAAHWSPADHRFRTGAEDRANRDPGWAQVHWGQGLLRPDGNEPMEIGGFVQAGKLPDDEQENEQP